MRTLCVKAYRFEYTIITLLLRYLYSKLCKYKQNIDNHMNE